MKIHHVGYYVQDIKKARNIFSMMGFDEESEEIYDEERGINVLFLTNGENRIELIEKCTEESDVDFIAKGKRSIRHDLYILLKILFCVYVLELPYLYLL